MQMDSISLFSATLILQIYRIEVTLQINRFCGLKPGNLITVYNIIYMGRKVYSILQTEGLQANFWNTIDLWVGGLPGILTSNWVFCIQG